MKINLTTRYLFPLGLLVGCMAAKNTLPVQADADRMQPVYPGITVADISNGKTIYEQKCSTCHPLKKPGNRTSEAWKHIVPEMAAKANKKTPGKITVADEEIILKYLITMATAPK